MICRSFPVCSTQMERKKAGMKCVIFAGLPAAPELHSWWADADYVIAADAGYENACRVGVEPDLLLGDYDSAPRPEAGAKTVFLPAEKDDTDTYYAARKALELGADYVINGKEEDAVERIRELTGGKGADLGIETAGSQITASQLIRAAKKGAVIVFVGYSATGEMTLPIGMALDKELTFKTVFRYRNIYPMAIEAVAGGKIRIKDIVTDYFELDDIKNALDSCVHNKADIVKGVIKVC